ncbi:hypothetical protein PYCC9005_005535 [Savitreella phatthalungensis]
MSANSDKDSVDLLILGAGWTSTFLIPLLKEERVSFAATTTTGHDNTISWRFDPDEVGHDSYKLLPRAQTVLVTFPLKGTGQSRKLIESYNAVHGQAFVSGRSDEIHFIQLGSTGIWGGGPTSRASQSSDFKNEETWVTRHSPYNREDLRAIAEDEFKSLGGVILNLSGLWGGPRQPRNFVSRVAGSKEQLAGKSSLHMIHGRDVSRGVLAVHRKWPGASRWLLTDTFVYDWWALAIGWGDGGTGTLASGDTDVQGKQAQWVLELMKEQNVRALPRPPETLTRALDSTEFWHTFGIWPVRARI